MELTAGRVVLREPRVEDAEALEAYHARNAEYFERFEPSHRGDAAVQRAWIENRLEGRARGSLQSFFAFLPADPERVAGIVSLDSISAGPGANAMLAFSIDRELEGRGLAFEMSRAACSYGFERLGLEFVIAYHHPANARSAALLARLGFTEVVRPLIPTDLAHLIKPHVMMVLARS